MREILFRGKRLCNSKMMFGSLFCCDDGDCYIVNPVGRVFDTCIQRNENGLWHLEALCGADIGIRFCPMCGRRLPQPPKGE